MPVERDGRWLLGEQLHRQADAESCCGSSTLSRRELRPTAIDLPRCVQDRCDVLDQDHQVQ
jgi:hypothetical protein